MGVYPCRGCGALFISVNMTQEPHAPGCPVAELNKLRDALAAERARTDALVAALNADGGPFHREVEQAINDILAERAGRKA